jgi:hypothetical protein
MLAMNLLKKMLPNQLSSGSAHHQHEQKRLMRLMHLRLEVEKQSARQLPTLQKNLTSLKQCLR